MKLKLIRERAVKMNCSFLLPMSRKEQSTMTKPREKTREELQAEIEDGKKKIRQFENGDRILKKTECLSSFGRAKEREKAEIISELRQRYPLKDLLQISGMRRKVGAAAR